MLRVLASGRFPDDSDGVRVAALAARAGPDSAALIRQYWEIQCWLVVKAEQVLLDQSSASELLTTSEAREAFAQRDGLKKALGPSLVSALKPLLPFSRNDLWEVAELRERLASSEPPPQPIRS